MLSTEPFFRSLLGAYFGQRQQLSCAIDASRRDFGFYPDIYFDIRSQFPEEPSLVWAIAELARISRLREPIDISA